MLTQINHWMDYAAAGIDGLLLLRVLGLRLQRMYVFITLTCVLSVIFDVANLIYGEQYPRVQLYSDLFVSLIFPLAAWDIFEEIAAAAAPLRRLAMLRTVASMILIAVFGVLMLSWPSDAEDPTGLAFIFGITVVVSTGSMAACLGFLWIMRGGLIAQKIPTPRNTSVWMMFYALIMAAQLVSWFVLMGEDVIDKANRENISGIAGLALNAFGMAVTLWCVAKLRGLPKDIPSASLNENS